MSTGSGNLQIESGVTAEKATKFLNEAARYFEGRPTGGEDSAYWANVYNAEWCREIAAFIDRSIPRSPSQTTNNDNGEE